MCIQIYMLFDSTCIYVCVKNKHILFWIFYFLMHIYIYICILYVVDYQVLKTTYSPAKIECLEEGLFVSWISPPMILTSTYVSSLPNVACKMHKSHGKQKHDKISIYYLANSAFWHMTIGWNSSRCQWHLTPAWSQKTLIDISTSTSKTSQRTTSVFAKIKKYMADTEDAAALAKGKTCGDSSSWGHIVNRIWLIELSFKLIHAIVPWRVLFTNDHKLHQTRFFGWAMSLKSTWIWCYTC